MLGHGQSTSTYPSAVDYVTLDHLQEHGPGKHSIENCKIELRTIQEYIHYYHENMADNRNNFSMRKNMLNTII